MKHKKLLIIGVVLLGLALLGTIFGSDSENDKSDSTSAKSYKLQLDVTLEENIVMSTYDVEIYIDDEKQGIVKQGETYAGEVTVEEGTHEIRFNKSGDTSVSGETSIEIKEDTAFTCSLKSHHGSIDINDQMEESLKDYNARKDAEKAKEDEEAASQKAEEERAETEQQEKEDSKAEPEPSPSSVVEPITVDNNAEWNSLIQISDPDEGVIREFANKYSGKTIEFDGNVQSVEDGSDSIVIYYGDYDAENTYSHNGPLILLRNADVSKVEIGDNVHIKAKVVPYNEKSYMMYLDHESITKR